MGISRATMPVCFTEYSDLTAARGLYAALPPGDTAEDRS